MQIDCIFDFHLRKLAYSLPWLILSLSKIVVRYWMRCGWIRSQHRTPTCNESVTSHRSKTFSSFSMGSVLNFYQGSAVLTIGAATLAVIMFLVCSRNRFNMPTGYLRASWTWDSRRNLLCNAFAGTVSGAFDWWRSNATSIMACYILLFVYFCWNRINQLYLFQRHVSSTA